MMRLDDIYVRVPLDTVALERAIYLAALMDTGAVRIDGGIAAAVAANDGRKYQSRYWQDLPTPDDTALPGAGPVYTDDSDNAIGSAKITHSVFDGVKSVPAMSWAEKDVVRTVGYLPDPLGTIIQRVGFYWARYYDQVAIAQCVGVFADNVANDGGDMTNNIGNAANPPDPANTVSPEAIIDTLQTAGDHYEMFTTMVCHSVVMSNLRKQNLVDSIPASDGRTIFQFYQGMRIQVSDQVYVDTGGANPLYHSYFFAPGALGFGSTQNGIVPSEVWRDPRQGMGGGDSQLITRVHFSMHPYGFTWTDTSVTGSSADTSGDPLWPNLTDYRNPVNWSRSASDRKHVLMAQLISNG